MTIPDLSIRLIKNSDIDKTKWDHCITIAQNGLIYGYSFYLDHMAKNWDALVYGDYEAVMPLTWNRKFGYSYLYQPPFAASLGVFGNNLSVSATDQFIRAIPAKFRLAEISLNHGNAVTNSSFIQERVNFVLPLSSSYDALYNGYRENIRRNVKKSLDFGCWYQKDIPFREVLELSHSQMSRISNLTKHDYHNLGNLYEYLYPLKMATACGIYTASGQLVASCIFFFSHNRAYYIVVGNHPNGRTLGASHLLIDRFIMEMAGTNLILDFEGSDIRNLAFFYSSFGAKPEMYPVLRINRLPRWVNILRSWKGQRGEI